MWLRDGYLRMHRMHAEWVGGMRRGRLVRGGWRRRGGGGRAVAEEGGCGVGAGGAVSTETTDAQCGAGRGYR